MAYTVRMETNRYARQQLLRVIGDEGQARLSRASVLLVGAGGLGCVVAPLLVGAGIGHLMVVDHDVVALSNLHRQTLYREDQVGLAKVTCMQALLSGLNSQVRVTALQQRCAPDTVAAMIQEADVVIDAADNFAVSYLLSEACAAQSMPLVAASVNATFGNVGVFCAAGLPTYRAAFPRVPDQVVSCDVVGVTGPSVAAIGAFQAQLALRALLENDLPAVLYQFELWDFALHEIHLKADSEASESPLVFIDQSSIGDDWVVDVREAAESAAEPFSHHNVLHVPLSELNQTTSIDQTRPWVLACRSGQRALIAAQRLALLNHPMRILLPSGLPVDQRSDDD